MIKKSGSRSSGSQPDAAEEALLHLLEELTVAEQRLDAARTRAEDLLRTRRTGISWSDIVVGEAPPLIVELLSQVQQDLGTAGSSWRREEAAALHAEGMTMERIAELFGVTRQRVSALLR
jgi:hypothetical protein